MKLRTPRRPFLFFEKSVYGKGARVYIFRKMSPKYTRNNDFTEKTAQNAASGVFPEIFLPKLHPFCQNGCISAKKILRVTPDARFFVKKRAKSMNRVYIARKNPQSYTRSRACPMLMFTSGVFCCLAVGLVLPAMMQLGWQTT